MAKVSSEYLPLSVLGEFPSDWNESTLEEVCHQVTDGTHDSPKPVAEGGYPLVTGKAIKDRRVDFSVTYNISDAEHQKVIERSKPERDDILFANIGNSIGDLVRVQTDRPFSIKNVALFKPNPSKVSARYLEYFLLSEQVQGFIKGSTRGSAQPFIGLGSLRGFPVPLPPMNEQLSIGALLGALDDRITLLRETNATLEAIAQALFKSWFVDFDPVRVKAEGRQPEGMDATTAALFPDSFEESELGLVPKGWSVACIGKIADVIDCLHAKKPELVDTGYPFLQLNNIKDDGLLDVSRVSFVTLADYQKWTSRVEVKCGDCVITNVGRVGAVSQIPSGFTAAMGRNMTAIRLRAEWPFPTYLIELMQSNFMRAEIVLKTDEGTILSALNVKSIPHLRCILPSVEIMIAFERVARPLRASMEENAARIQTLTQLRDTLLPRLISGQLRLPEAEALLENAL